VKTKKLPPHAAKKLPTKAGKKKVAAKPKATAKSKSTNALRDMMRGSDRPVEARDTDPRAPFSAGGQDRDVDPSKAVRARRG
jgi:hypothetical protein